MSSRPEVLWTGVERSDLLQIRFLDFGLRPPLEMTVYFSALLQGGDFRLHEAKDTDPPGGNAPNLPKYYNKIFVITFYVLYLKSKILPYGNSIYIWKDCNREEFYRP